MAYFAESKPETVKLPSNPSYWVKINTELQWKEAKRFANFQDNDISYALDQLLLSMITDWNLDDGEGNILPVDSENIDRLKREDAEALVAAVGAVIQNEAPAQKKSS